MYTSKRDDRYLPIYTFEFHDYKRLSRDPMDFISNALIYSSSRTHQPTSGSEAGSCYQAASFPNPHRPRLAHNSHFQSPYYQFDLSEEISFSFDLGNDASHMRHALNPPVLLNCWGARGQMPMVHMYLYCTITRMRKAEDLVICSVVTEQGFALI
jgi:hypothetical protein